MSKQQLVLDLDSTLIHSSSEMWQYESLSKDPILRDRIYKIKMYDPMEEGDGSYMDMWGVFRPYLSIFLNYAEKRFDKVHIWSAGTKRYVEQIVKVVYEDEDFKPKTVWSRKMCENKPYLHKPLHKLHRLGSSNHKNTFIVDDRSDNFLLNKDNGILIPPYEPQPNYHDIMKNEVALLQLLAWFSIPEVANSSDVRLLRKDNIFTIPLPVYEVYLKQYAGI